MASEWYFSHGGQQLGPISDTELKELAASGKLFPNDLVWKEGMAEWMNASKVKGLFPTAKGTTSPPPIPAKAKETPGAKVPPLPSKGISEGAIADGAKSRRQDLLETAKQAKELGQAHARKLKIIKSTLPKAYLALGQFVYERKQFQSEFGNLFQKLNQKSDDRSLLRELGQGVFESHGDAAGPNEIVSQIVLARTEVEELDTEIMRLSAEGKGKVLTPKRLMFGGLALVGFMVLMVLSAMFDEGSASSGTSNQGADMPGREREIRESNVDASKGKQEYRGRHGEERRIEDFLSGEERRAYRNPIHAENLAEAYKKRTNKGYEYVIFSNPTNSGQVGQFYFDGQETKIVHYFGKGEGPKSLEIPEEVEWRDKTIPFTPDGTVDMFSMPDRSKWKYND